MYYPHFGLLYEARFLKPTPSVACHLSSYQEQHRHEGPRRPRRPRRGLQRHAPLSHRAHREREVHAGARGPPQGGAIGLPRGRAGEGGTPAPPQAEDLQPSPGRAPHLAEEAGGGYSVSYLTHINI